MTNEFCGSVTLRLSVHSYPLEEDQKSVLVLKILLCYHRHQFFLEKEMLSTTDAQLEPIVFGNYDLLPLELFEDLVVDGEIGEPHHLERPQPVTSLLKIRLRGIPTIFNQSVFKNTVKKSFEIKGSSDGAPVLLKINRNMSGEADTPISLIFDDDADSRRFLDEALVSALVANRQVICLHVVKTSQLDKNGTPLSFIHAIVSARPCQDLKARLWQYVCEKLLIPLVSSIDHLIRVPMLPGFYLIGKMVDAVQIYPIKNMIEDRIPSNSKASLIPDAVDVFFGKFISARLNNDKLTLSVYDQIHQENEMRSMVKFYNSIVDYPGFVEEDQKIFMEFTRELGLAEANQIDNVLIQVLMYFYYRRG